MKARRRVSGDRLALAAGALVILGAACTKIVEIPRVASNVTALAGSDGQIGVAGQPLPNAVRVLVLDQVGSPLANAKVTWSILRGNGSVAQTQSTSDDSGVASVVWTLGPTVGANALQAQIISGLNDEIDATGVAGSLAKLFKVIGDSQTVNVGTASSALEVAALDQNNNVVSGAVVNWSTTGGSLTATTTTSDNSGVVQVQLTPSSVGPVTVTASAAGVTPVQFTVTGK